MKHKVTVEFEVETFPGDPHPPEGSKAESQVRTAISAEVSRRVHDAFGNGRLSTSLPLVGRVSHRVSVGDVSIGPWAEAPKPARSK